MLVDMSKSSTEDDKNGDHIKEMRSRIRGTYQYDEARELFKKTLEDFRGSLSEDKKVEVEGFADSKSMIDSIKDMCNDHKTKKSRLTRCCESISNLSNRLEPFFDIVSIFIQSHPEFAALAWGAVRLIFKIGVNYVTFLEKICDMLQDMSDKLPAYEDFISRIGKDLTSSRRTYPRLMYVLALLYRDVIGFCEEAFGLLSRKQGLRVESKLIWSVSWKPFDLRFGELLKRFTKHTELFELEMNVAQTNEMMTHYEAFQKQIKKTADLSAEMLHDRKKREKEDMECRLKELKNWINATSWEDFYEETMTQKIDATGEWLLQDPRYKKWLEGAESSWKDNLRSENAVIVIEGKPGYGKTFLCATLINQLRESVSMKSPPVGSMLLGSIKICFYFFSKLQNRLEKSTSSEAFRAVLAQLLHNHQDDQGMIDAASLIMHKNSKGQIYASQGEVMSLLQWSLQRHPNTILVFDAIDECQDIDKLFQGLRTIHSEKNTGSTPKLTNDHSVSRSGQIQAPSLHEVETTVTRPVIALFTRPDIRIPPYISRGCIHVHLNADNNFDDIISFLGPSLQDLIEDELLGDDQDYDDLLSRTTQHADGMFLWAKLLIDYLRWDGLSIQDRLDALDNLVLLEGLDMLYQAILTNLKAKLPRSLQEKSKDAFQWAIGSVRPLHLDEMRVALGINDATSLSEQSLIQKDRMERSISTISGALLEVAPDRTVRFAHLSIREYLSQEPSSFNGANHGYNFERHRTHRFLASSCLRYLVRHIPHEPLSGSSQETPDKELVRKRICLLDYCSRFWVRHAEIGLDSYNLEQPKTNFPNEDHSHRNLFQVIDEFVCHRQCTTAWIESSWVFAAPPSLGRLPKVLSTISRHRMAISMHFATERSPSDDIALENLASKLEQFNNDLGKLNKTWGHVLSGTPNEIWEPSIPAFTKSAFWSCTNDAAITSIGAGHIPDMDHILIRSHLSSTASEMGFVKIIPPRSILSQNVPSGISNREAWSSKYSSGWQASFEVWSIERKRLEFKLSIDLSESDITLLLLEASEESHYKQKQSSFKKLGFRCPVTMSDDLRKVLVLGSFIVVREIIPTNKPGATYRCVFDHKYLRPWAIQHSSHQSRNTLGFSYGAMLSPSGDYLFIARFSERNEDGFWLSSDTQLWDLMVYQGLNSPGWQQETSTVASMTAFLTSLPFAGFGQVQVDLFDRHFIFHPDLPVLCFVLRSNTVIWMFSDPGSEPIRVHRDPLEGLAFSTCGNYLHGRTSGRYKSPGLVVVGIKEVLETLRGHTPLEVTKRKQHSSQAIQGSSEGKISIRDLVAGGNQPLQKTNTITFRRDRRGLAEMSELQQSEAAGAVVLYTLCEDGTTRSETLSRIPKDMLSSEAVLLKGQSQEADESVVRVVLNKRPSNQYCFHDEGNLGAPVLIERKIGSIPFVFASVEEENMLELPIVKAINSS